ncbi:DUF4249 domain-containing protein [Flagellimonas pacifica]|nr:DUF4249 domain-containing protein [Allomuricauda parva]
MLGKSRTIARCVFAFYLIVLINGCIEPHDFTIPNGNNLVIDALLTDELKRHEVVLSRGYSFDLDSTIVETGANVKIMDDLLNEYSFTEVEGGRYVSDNEFEAKVGVGYTLQISTKDGSLYSSSSEKFDANSQIRNIKAERGINSFDKDGVKIFLENNALSGNPQYFRYEYEETYKIIAPKYVNLDFKLENYDPCKSPDTYDFSIVARDEQQKICYGFQTSSEIIQVSTQNQNESTIENQLVRFIPADDYILSHRYSILVKQYVQSEKAYSYYKSLDDFSSSESVFTDVQPGFLEGNVKSENNTEEKVLGLFEVASVSSKRLFFSYTDFFPDEPLPDYPFKCSSLARPPVSQPQVCNSSTFPHCRERSLYILIDDGSVAYWSETENQGCEAGPYIVVPRVCGDCTLLGSNEEPEFWIE